MTGPGDLFATRRRDRAVEALADAIELAKDADSRVIRLDLMVEEAVALLTAARSHVNFERHSEAMRRG